MKRTRIQTRLLISLKLYNGVGQHRRDSLQRWFSAVGRSPQSSKKPEPQDKAQYKIQADEYADREDLQAIIARLPYIQNPLPVDEFINPPEERIVEDEDSDIFEQVVERYGVSEDDIVDMAEDGVVQEEDISVSKAIEALETLKLFEIQQEDGSEALLHALDQAGTRYIKKKNESRKQVTIDSFFKAL